MTKVTSPHLSIVVVSRNDDHGGSMLERMQQFVDTLAFQCRKFDLSAELVFIEWNPPSDRRPLRSVLQWPSEPGPLSIRIVTVPNEIHSRYKHGDRLPLYQMIGKNVGIRRARGEFILATNVDIIFDDETVIYLRDKLQHGVLLRADRFDVPGPIPPGSMEDKLSFWRRNVFHVYTRFGIFDVKSGRFVDFGNFLDVDGSDRAIEYWADLECLYSLHFQGSSLARLLCSIADDLAKADHRDTSSAPYKEMLREMYRGNKAAHIYACGDFTLLSRQDWMNLAGYPELDAYSWDIDSVLIFAAFSAGVRQVVLPPSHRIFHIDHSKGSGWTPEGDEALFARLRNAQIPYLGNGELGELLAWRRRLYETSSARVLNPGDWGFSNIALPEVNVSAV